MRNKGTINTKTMKMETTMKTRVAERQIKDVINIGTRKIIRESKDLGRE